VLSFTGDPEADALLSSDPFALLVGLLLDQQVPMEWAFRAPLSLKRRLGDRFAVPAIAAMDPEELVAVFCEKPALHRYPAAMARRVHALCVHLVDQYGGEPANLWEGVASGDELFARIRALPGFGDEKARIFLALLAKRFDLRPVGWEERAGPFADEQPRSVADSNSREAFAEVREWKKARKAAGKGKAD
jgi:uncharacterized HhH-GPD family protein